MSLPYENATSGAPDLNELERLIKEASELPWHEEPDCDDLPVLYSSYGVVAYAAGSGVELRANAALIAAAVNALPDLIGRARELEKHGEQSKKLQTAFDDFDKAVYQAGYDAKHRTELSAMAFDKLRKILGN